MDPGESMGVTRDNALGARGRAELITLFVACFATLAEANCGFDWVTDAVCKTVDSTLSNQAGPRTICYGCPNGVPSYWSFPAKGGKGPACEILTWQPGGYWTGATKATPNGNLTKKTTCVRCHSSEGKEPIQLVSSSVFKPVNFACGRAETRGDIVPIGDESATGRSGETDSSAALARSDEEPPGDAKAFFPEDPESLRGGERNHRFQMPPSALSHGTR